jgi:SAM-dependent methyltransferase
MRIQVKPKHYSTTRYATKKRFISFWHQIDEIERLAPKSVLEIGIGTGFLRTFLQNWGVDVTTVDIDPDLRPSVAASVVKLPFKDGVFDAVACFQVLEHLPYSDVPDALMELARVARAGVILSLPDRAKALRVFAKIPPIPQIRIMVDLRWLPGRRHVFEGEHYWELNRRGYPLGAFVRMVEKCGLRILRTYRPFEHPYHRFFVLNKASCRDGGRPRGTQ